MLWRTGAAGSVQVAERRQSLQTQRAWRLFVANASGMRLLWPKLNKYTCCCCKKVLVATFAIEVPKSKFRTSNSGESCGRVTKDTALNRNEMKIRGLGQKESNQNSATLTNCSIADTLS